MYGYTRAGPAGGGGGGRGVCTVMTFSSMRAISFARHSPRICSGTWFTKLKTSRYLDTTVNTISRDITNRNNLVRVARRRRLAGSGAASGPREGRRLRATRSICVMSSHRRAKRPALARHDSSQNPKICVQTAGGGGRARPPRRGQGAAGDGRAVAGSVTGRCTV